MLAAIMSSQQSIGVWFQTHGFVSWLLLGLVAGWLAGKIARGRGFGCIADIVLGLIGSYIGGWIFVKLGIFGGGFLYSLAAATLGAVILVSIAHLFVGGNE
jgi:uncharacterized membrane protein YeaQ/YmgE (transglycosylase-associated protein family)